MISVFYSITVFFKNHTRTFWRIIYKINKLIINVLYPIVHFFSRKNGVDKNSNIIISITSYPGRINTVWLTIETLLSQKKVKPKKVILWLAKEQFENAIIPKSLIKMKKRGLDIEFCDDLKPHKKYYYSFLNYNNDIVITVDDDILYPENFVEKLYEASIKYPKAVICNWAHKIIIKDGKFANYRDWDMITNDLSMYTLPVGCCGVLYKPSMFDDEIYNKDVIKNCCLNTDDLWLKINEIRCGIPAININSSNVIFFSNIRNMKSGLYKTNAQNENRNDYNIELLLKKYPSIIKKMEDWK